MEASAAVIFVADSFTAECASATMAWEVEAMDCHAAAISASACALSGSGSPASMVAILDMAAFNLVLVSPSAPSQMAVTHALMSSPAERRAFVASPRALAVQSCNLDLVMFFICVCHRSYFRCFCHDRNCCIGACL